MSIKDVFDGIKGLFHLIYTSENTIYFICVIIVVLYTLSKFFQWLDKISEERSRKLRKERKKRQAELGYEDEDEL